MILNDDTEDGLTPEDNLAVKPDEIPNGPEHQVSLITPADNTKDLNAEVTPVDLFGPSAKVGELPNFDAQFQIVEDDTVKTVDLKDIQEQFSNQATISQEEAHYLDGRLQGQVFKAFNKNSFTKSPTRVNLSGVQKFLADKLALESLERTKEISIFFTQPTVTAVEIINYVLETTLPALREILESKQYGVASYQERLDALNDKSEGCFYTGEKFEHFLGIVATDYDTEKQGIYYRSYEGEEPTNERNEKVSVYVNEVIANIQLVLKDHHLCSYLEAVREHIPFADQTQEQNTENMIRAEKVRSTYTFKDLIDVVLRNPETIEQLNTLEAELRKVKDGLENKAKVFAGNDASDLKDQALKAFLEKDAPEVHKLFRNMHHILHIVKNLYLLQSYVSSFADAMMGFIYE